MPNEVTSLRHFDQFLHDYQKERGKYTTYSHSQQKEIQAFLNALIKQNTLAMCVPLYKLKDILESETIKSKTELVSDFTKEEREIRKQVIKQLFGCDLSRMKPFDYPKYGFLMDQNVLRHILQDGNLVFQYGNVIFKFKDHIRSRTTICVGSSLNFKEYERKKPVRLHEPYYTCISVHHEQSFYRKMKSGSLKIDQPGALSQVMEDQIGFENYELQFHGSLTMSDIEQVYLYPMNDEDAEKFKECTAILDHKGISWQILSF